MGQASSKEEVIIAQTGDIHVETHKLQWATLSILSVAVLLVGVYYTWRRCRKFYKRQALEELRVSGGPAQI